MGRHKPDKTTFSRIEDIEPFEVKEIGTFYKLTETDNFSYFWTRFKRIPLHFHKKIEEIFYVTGGEGILSVYDLPKRLKSGEYCVKTNSLQDTEIRKGTIVRLPPCTPHRLDVLSDTLDTFIITKPPYNAKDEFQVKMLV